MKFCSSLLLGVCIAVSANCQTTPVAAPYSDAGGSSGSLAIDTVKQAKAHVTTEPSQLPEINRNSAPYWRIRSGSTMGRPSQVTAADPTGKVWYNRMVPSGEAIAFGGDFPDGTYFIRIKNGNKLRLVKAIKSSD